MNALLLVFVLACARQNQPAAVAPEPATEVAAEPAAQPAPEADPIDEPAEEPTEEPAPEPTADLEPPQPLPAVGAAADGAACQSHSDCRSGTCEGEGCGTESPGVCARQMRACTRDLRQYCGCDGQTFQGSGSCPNQRFAHKGPCTP